MNTVTFKFRGLCIFLEDAAAKAYDVFLLKGHAHPPHKAVLVVEVKSVDLAAGATTWMPSYVGWDANNKQIGIWDLDREVMTTPGLPASPAVSFADRSSGAIDLPYLHKKQGDTLAARKGTAEIEKGGAARLRITAGTLSCIEKQLYTVLQGGASVAKDNFGSAIQWVTPPVDFVTLKNKAGDQLCIFENANVSISNIAAVPSAAGVPLPHFTHYYDVLTKKPTGREFEVQQSHADVFDCVPPVPGP